MTFVQRNRLRAALAVLLAAVSVLVLLTRLHYAPVLAQLAALQLDNQASAAINDAVQDTLTAEEITYDKLVELEKDTQGNVTAVRSNVAGLNRFRTALTARIDEKLVDLSVEELGIPVGSVVLPELFSGLKVAATYSISGAVVGEWLGSQKGLGYYLLRVKNSYMLDKVFACVVVIILLSLAMNGLIRVIAMVSMPYERNKRS